MTLTIESIKISEKYLDYNRGDILGRGSDNVVTMVTRKSDEEKFALMELNLDKKSEEEQNAVLSKVLI